jgi:integrase
MPIFLTVEQIQGLLQIAARSSPRDHAILRLAANTGLRESDILKLRRSDILTPAGEVVQSLSLKMKKTGKVIEKSLTEPTREAISAYLRTAPKSLWLFTGEFAHNPLSRRTVDRIFKRHLSTLLGDGVSLRGSATHSLRRSVAYIVYERHGVASASIFLGHSSLQNTICYLDRHKQQQKGDQLIRDLDL